MDRDVGGSLGLLSNIYWYVVIKGSLSHSKSLANPCYGI